MIFFVTGKLPHKTGNGSSVLTYALMNCFIKLGFEITIVPVHLRYDNKQEQLKHLNSLKQSGIRVKMFDDIKYPRKTTSRLARLRQIISPQVDDYYHYSDSLKPELLSFLERQDKQNTVLTAYSWQAVALISNIKGFLKIATVVDPIEKYLELRRELTPTGIRRKIRHKMNLLRARKQPTYAYDVLRKMNIVIEHAYHHTLSLVEKGYKNAYYIPHPLPVQEAIEFRTNPNNTTVLISGSLKGTASRHGFLFFLNEILPRFKKRRQELSTDVTFRVVGHGKMEKSLRSRLEKEPLVDFVGFVDSMEDAYKNADIILVNIPVTLGFRTRIAEAFSYGLCVVTHAANAEGMPEIQDKENAISDSNPERLVDELVRLINEPISRQEFGENAKLTFDYEMSEPIAVKRLEAIFMAHRVLPIIRDKKRKKAGIMVGASKV